jgi:cell wall-associated NlpC family hydrolase
VTGYFGSDTDSAVRSFQNTNRLSVDGKVGPQTMSVLMSENAKKSTGVNITGSNAGSLISVANSKRGCKYVRGAKGPNQFDCSGFVYWCLNKVGVHQGYMTSHAWANSSKYKKITKMGDLKKGDIIVYNGHVAICAGGGYQIDASSHNRKVVKRQYTGSSYWSSSFICGFRIF